MLLEILIGGSETISVAMRWAILLLARHPEVQRKMQKEIDAHFGKKRPSYISDKENLTYCEAVIYEILRVSTVQSWIIRRTSADVDVLGHRIPRDSLVMPNFLAMHRDPTVWPDPQNFNPNNFFEEETNSLKRANSMVTFSLGMISATP